MGDSSLALFGQLRSHLQRVQEAPDTPLDQDLLLQSELFLVPQISHDVERQLPLVAQIAGLLPQLQQQPGTLVKLLEKLSAQYSFSDVLSLQPPVDFVAGLGLTAVPYNNLMISLIKKAAISPSGVALLANLPEVVKALVHLWLHTPEAGVADAAEVAVLDLLTADREPSRVSVHGVGADGRSDDGLPTGQGLLWRRLFGDKEIYGKIFSACGSGPVKERSLAQARLMSITPKLGKLDWFYLLRSHHRDVESQYGLSSPDSGLLDFIAVHMVDYADDVLMHVNLMQFFVQLITDVREPSEQKHLSLSLQFLQNRGLHDRTIAYWLKPNDPSHSPIDLTFLYGPAANYYATYASLYPEALLQDHHIRQADDGIQSALVRLSRALGMSENQWSQGGPPQNDLHVLVSLPRVTLLPHSPLGTERQSTPLLLIPCKNTNPDALACLATIFHGPEKQPLTFPPDADDALSANTRAERAAARALYTLYLHAHPSLFADLARHASTIALPDKAIAAIRFIALIATATWAALPTTSSYDRSAPPQSPGALPSDAVLESTLPRDPDAAALPRTTAATGIQALLQSPVREQVFPFLLRPPQTFNNLVGGRGDPESSAYRVAVAKWDCLRAVRAALAAVPSLDADGARVRAALDERVREGMWGASSEAGGHVAALEL